MEVGTKLEMDAAMEARTGAANSLRAYNVRARKTDLPPEVHDTAEARKLKEACQQFESILWAQVWKKTRANARALGGGKPRVWGQMEDLSVEMASEELAKSGGAGLWKVLYDQMIGSVAAGKETKTEGGGENVPSA
jgi:Rod binding domain-containing protein